MGPKSLDKLAAFARVRGQSIFEALIDPDGEMLDTLPGRSYDKVKEMVTVMKECREQRSDMSVSDIYDALLVRTGYLKSLEDEKSVEAESRIENLMEFKPSSPSMRSPPKTRP